MSEEADLEGVGRDLLQGKLEESGGDLHTEFMTTASAIGSDDRDLTADDIESMYQMLEIARNAVDYAARATPGVEPEIRAGKLWLELADARGEDVEQTIERVGDRGGQDA